jgi:hypothetical protein
VGGWKRDSRGPEKGILGVDYLLLLLLGSCYLGLVGGSQGEELQQQCGGTQQEGRHKVDARRELLLIEGTQGGVLLIEGTQGELLLTEGTQGGVLLIEGTQRGVLLIEGTRGGVLLLPEGNLVGPPHMLRGILEGVLVEHGGSKACL